MLIMIEIQKGNLNVNNKSFNLSRLVILSSLKTRNAFSRRLLTTKWGGVDPQKQQVLKSTFNLTYEGIIMSITKDIIGCKNEQGEMVQCKKQNIYQRNVFEQSYD